MGYAQTTIVLYGVQIDEDVAKKIYENEFDAESGEFSDPEMYKNIFYRKNFAHTAAHGVAQEQPVTPYKHHGNGSDSAVFDPQLLSEDTDSRINSLIFEEGYQHYLGIYIASKGYAYTDNIKPFIKNTPQEAVKNFELNIQPMMKKYGIKGEPNIHLISQVW